MNNDLIRKLTKSVKLVMKQANLFEAFWESIQQQTNYVKYSVESLAQNFHLATAMNLKNLV